MSDSKPPKVHGTVAEFDSVDTLLAACRRVRDAGYTETDAYTPFPVHGIDPALGIKPTKLPWICLIAGLTGTCTALVMQSWMNGYNYPYIISGKPYFSWPAFMPVAFELTILFASFGAFFGMWALNKLPRFSNPVFTDPRFDRATDDRFFLYIGSKDDKYNQDSVNKLLGDIGGEYINEVVEDESSNKVPKFIFLAWMVVAAFSVIPLLVALKMRLTRSDQPRFHIFFDMDFSPSRDAQQNTTLFADARAMRPDVSGTVARGQQGMDTLTGIDMEKLALINPDRAQQLVARYDDQQFIAKFDEPADEDDDDAKTEDANPEDAAPETAGSESTGEESTGEEESAKPSVMDTTPWLQEIPFTVNKDFVYQGQKYFNIYCAVCHGNNGSGNGLVNRRAQKILAQNWIPPSNLHESTLHSDKYADGKLFNTISNGIRKMPGYASQIKVEDRWAIVAYVRAIQASGGGSLEQVPTDQREAIEAEKAEIEKKLKEEEEKAKQEKAKQEEAKK